MNILFFGSDELLARVRQQVVGLSWDIYRVAEPYQVLDYDGTHSFQAGLFGLCEDSSAIRAAVEKTKCDLNVPVTIGLACQSGGIIEKARPNLDIVIADRGNDRLTKLQCDAILRLANGATSEILTCGGVDFHTSEDKFSVNGADIYLSPKKHKLLELLFVRRGRVVTKQMIFNQLYGWDEPPDPRVVDVFVCHIRRTLREAGLQQECIQTVWGQGYRVPNHLAFEARQSA